MNYIEAMAEVALGKYAWRPSPPWTSGTYVHANGNDIYVYPADVPYVATMQDEEATDWDSGDHPPK